MPGVCMRIQINPRAYGPRFRRHPFAFPPVTLLGDSCLFFAGCSPANKIGQWATRFVNTAINFWLRRAYVPRLGSLGPRGATRSCQKCRLCGNLSLPILQQIPALVATFSCLYTCLRICLPFCLFASVPVLRGLLPGRLDSKYTYTN